MRYENSSVLNMESNQKEKYLDKADELLNFIMNIQIPEIDLDAYKIGMNISAEEFAMKKVREFKNSFFSASISSSNSNSNPRNNNASIGESSDEGGIGLSHTKSAHEIVYKVDTIGSDATQKSDINE